MTATPNAHRRELTGAESRLAATLDQPDDWAVQPSSLPDWTRGHVVAHLLGNVEGLMNLLTWAQSGVETPMYPSPVYRKTQIDELAGRSLARLREDLGAAVARFAAGCEELHEPLGARELRLGSGAVIESWELPMIRVREVEIHHVDLSAGYRSSDWAPTFTLRTMGQITSQFAGRGDLTASCLRASDTGRVWSFDNEGPALIGQESDLLAWLIGRPQQGELVCSDGSVLPAAPRWV